MYSMTGYGKGEYREGGLEVTVEMKSVNNRFLDVSFKAPRVFFAAEERVRAAVRGCVSRGHIDIFVSVSDRRPARRALAVDLEAARAYLAAAKSLKAAFPEIEDDLTLTGLLRQPEILSAEDAAGCDEELLEALDSALAAALAAHAEMRRAEGERLKKDLFARMETIASLREEIASRAPLVAEAYREKLTARICELLDGKADETRILTEAAVYSDKCNIDEELTRLASHIEEFYKICAEEQTGRKLDFLVQEFNRECNTICSKSNDGPLTKCALAMKNEIEKVREQVQNLE